MAATALVSVDPEAERNATALWRKTSAGRYPRAGQNELFLGESVARTLGVSIGDTVLVGTTPTQTDRELVLCGTFRTGIAPLDQVCLFALTL
jgi:hypothetical protein